MNLDDFVSLMKKKDYEAVYAALKDGFNPNKIYYWTEYYSNASPDGYGCIFPEDLKTYPVRCSAKILDLLGHQLDKDPAMEKLLRAFGATTEQDDRAAELKKMREEEKKRAQEQKKRAQEQMNLVDDLLARDKK